MTRVVKAGAGVHVCLQSGCRQVTHESSPLCRITCDDGTVYTVCATIRAQLIELNERLLSQPQVLVHKVRSLLVSM